MNCAPLSVVRMFEAARVIFSKGLRLRHWHCLGLDGMSCFIHGYMRQTPQLVLTVLKSLVLDLLVLNSSNVSQLLAGSRLLAGSQLLDLPVLDSSESSQLRNLFVKVCMKQLVT